MAKASSPLHSLDEPRFYILRAAVTKLMKLSDVLSFILAGEAPLSHT